MLARPQFVGRVALKCRSTTSVAVLTLMNLGMRRPGLATRTDRARSMMELSKLAI
jgi:hypothetical protein